MQKNHGKLKTIIPNAKFLIRIQRQLLTFNPSTSSGQAFKLLTPKGFTLIELLIGIVIIGILAVSLIAVLNPLEQIKKTRDSQRKHDFDQLRKALEIYFIENDGYPNLYALFGGADPWGQAWLPYMAKIPKDPNPNQSYYYQLPYDANGAYDTTRYTLYAKLEKCPDPQMIPGSTCTDNYNYAVASPNIAVAALPTPPPLPTLTSTPLPIKRVFVTSSMQNGNFAGLTGADLLCRSLASTAGLGGMWNAWLSTSSEDAKSRVPNAKYILVDNMTVVANNKEDLIDDSIQNSIKKDQDGTLVTGAVWTGTLPNGTAADSRCNDWTSDSAEVTSRYGNTGLNDDRWTHNRADTLMCSSLRRLYCFEQ